MFPFHDVALLYRDKRKTFHSRDTNNMLHEIFIGYVVFFSGCMFCSQWMSVTYPHALGSFHWDCDNRIKFAPVPVKYPLMLYSDVIMDAIASQITSPTIVYSTVYSGADQTKHQRLRVTGLCMCGEITELRVTGLCMCGEITETVEFPATCKWPVTRKNVSIWWRHHGINNKPQIRPKLRTVYST